MSGGWQPVVVVDAKLAAPRGEAASAGAWVPAVRIPRPRAALMRRCCRSVLCAAALTNARDVVRATERAAQISAYTPPTPSRHQQAAGGDADDHLPMDRLDEGGSDDDDARGLGFSYPQGEPTQVASASTALDGSNKGFQLLQKLGWRSGKGLGRNEDGILEPVSTGVDGGARLGLGKQAQDDHFTNPELITRKLLESEVQANEDADRRVRREVRCGRNLGCTKMEDGGWLRVWLRVGGCL